MVTKVTMPKLGLTMTEGTVVNWLKKEGEHVEKGEPILEVETEKISNVVEAPASGLLLKVLASEGTVVPVAGVVAFIGELGEEVSTAQIEAPVESPIPAEEAKETEKAETPLVAVSEERVKISPLARKIAEEYRIDLTTIKGTGPEGRIVKEDVLRVIEEAKATEGMPSTVGGLEVAEIIPLSGMRKTIAERLSQSYHSAVHTSVIREIDITEMVNFRQRILLEIKEKTGASPTYTSILVKAVATALKDHPIVNSTLEGDYIKIIKDINIGVAVDLKGGLIVPVIRRADKKTLAEIAPVLEALIERARNQLLSFEEVAAGTFTVTNLGMLGIQTFIPIINPPQVAILSVGSIDEKPVVVEGKIEIRPRMNFALVYDHRIIDGAEAARFLQTLNRILQNPSKLLS